MTNETYSGRISFIDQCKGIGILLVVYGHCITPEWEASVNGAALFTKWFTSYHMPLFFVLGGCLLAFKREVFSFPETLLKKAKRLLLPGVYFTLLTILMFTVIKLLSGRDWIQYLTGRLVELTTLQFQGAMWFLPCFFFAEIAFLFLMMRTVVMHQALIVSVISFAAALWMNSIPSVPIRFSRLLMALCFIAIGYWMYQTVPSLSSRTHTAKQRLILAGGGVLLLSFVVVGSSINGEVSCSGAVFGRYPFLFLLDGIAGSMGFILITIATGKKNSFLEFYGRNSLTILCTHLILIDLFWVFNSQVLHLSLRAVDARLFAIGVILLEAPMIHIINKYFPWLIGLKKQRNGQD